MDDEKLLILRMVQAGKITAEEAAALLEAIGTDAVGVNAAQPVPETDTPTEKEQYAQLDAQVPETHEVPPEHLVSPEPPVSPEHLVPPPPTHKVASEEWHHALEEKIQSKIENAMKRVEQTTGKVANKGPQIAEQVAGQVAEQMSKFGDNMGKFGESMGKFGEKMAGLSKLSALGNLSHLTNLAGIGHLLTGAGTEITREYAGVFGEEDKVKVSLETANGSIQVKSWDEPGYKVVAVIKVRAANAEEAQRLADNGVCVSSNPAELKVDTEERNGVSGVSLTVYLPTNRLYDFTAESTNGGVNVAGLSCMQCRAETTNGGVKITQVKALDMTVESTNGGLHIEQVQARTARAETTNGGISWQGSALRFTGETTNGSIRVQPASVMQLQQQEQTDATLRAEYKLESCNGGITVQLEGDAAAAAVSFSAESAHGKINTPSDGCILHKRETPGTHELRGELEGSNNEHLNLNLETVHGSITITRSTEMVGHKEVAVE